MGATTVIDACSSSPGLCAYSLGGGGNDETLVIVVAPGSNTGRWYRPDLSFGHAFGAGPAWGTPTPLIGGDLSYGSAARYSAAGNSGPGPSWFAAPVESAEEVCGRGGYALIYSISGGSGSSVVSSIDLVDWQSRAVATLVAPPLPKGRSLSMTVGRDGTVIQTILDDANDNWCTWRWWTGLLKSCR